MNADEAVTPDRNSADADNAGCPVTMTAQPGTEVIAIRGWHLERDLYHGTLANS